MIKGLKIGGLAAAIFFSLFLSCATAFLHGSTGCTVPCDPPQLTFTQIQADSGTAATRPDTNWGPGGPNFPGTSRTPCALGIFPYALPEGYSWFCGGDEYLGDPTRWGNTGSYLGVGHTAQCTTDLGFTCTAMTEWHIIYVEATDMTGTVAKATVTGTNVWYRKRQSWCHLAAGGWASMQVASTANPIVTGRLEAPQGPNNQSDLTVTDHGGGVFSEQAPPFAVAPGWANHGWIQDRGSYTSNTVDGCFSYMEARVDQTGDNHLINCGIDWWQNSGSGTGTNTGEAESMWKRLTVNWTSVVCTALPLSLLQADPPPVPGGILP